MPVFYEKLCEHVGIVRSGPDAHVFGDPYVRSLVVHIEGRYAVPKGFADAGFSTAEYRQAIAAINRATGKLVAYDRAKDAPYRIVQIDPGQTKGKIVMQKHHVNEAKKSDGTVDHAKLSEGAAYWMGEFQAGRAKIIAGDQSELPNGDTLIWFIRHNS